MILDWRKQVLPPLALLALSTVLFGFQLGTSGLLDPDEPFYSLTAKEMLERNDPSTPVMFGKPQFEKPIFFYWVLYANFRWLGVGEFSARLGPCVAGVLTVLVTYFWALALFKSRRTAFVSGVVLAASAQFIVLSRIVLTDIFLCLFVTTALFFFTLGHQNPRRRTLYWNLVFVFCGLGFLTKGPLGLLIPFSGILSFIALSRQRALFSRIPWVSGWALFILIAVPWYALMEARYGPGFLEHFFVHENVRRFFVAEHRGSDKFFFYPFVLLIGFFPWSAFLFPTLGYAVKSTIRRRTPAQKAFLLLSLSLLLPLLFFNQAKSKLMSYIFPMYPCVAILAGAWMERAYRATRYHFAVGGALRWGQAVVWGIAPLGLLGGVYAYSRLNAIDILAPLSVIGATFLPLSWAALAMFLARKYRGAFFCALAGVLCFTGLSFGWLLPAAGSAFSSKGWAQDYDRLVQHQQDPLILSSKLFVRGISYYTGDPNVAVFSNKPKGGFYTPHPIRIVSDIQGLSAMPLEQFPVYCLLRQKEVRALREMIDERFSVSVLEGGRLRSWVRLDRV